MFEPGQGDYIALTILDGDSSQQIFSIGGSNIEIFGLTLQNGYSTSWGGAIGIGSYRNFGEKLDPRESRKIILNFFDQGINFIDSL